MAKSIRQIEQFYAARDQFLERPLPSNNESERAILGVILLDNDLISQAAETLTPDDFYSPFHRAVFAGMLELFGRGSKIDPILIGEELKKEGKLESYGGVAAIANLTYGIPHFKDIDSYVKIIKGKSELRQLIKACNTVVSEALAEEDEPEVILDRAEQLVFALRDSNKKNDSFESIGSNATDVIGKIQDFSQRKDKTALLGITTGYRDLDAFLFGLQNTDLILVAARPSMGKTALTINIGIRAAQRDPDVTVAYFSCEMSKEQLTMRVVAQEAMIDATRLRNAFLSRNEWERIAETYGNLQELDFHIDDTPAITPMQLRAKARRLKLKKKKKKFLIIVDYLQLMRGSKGKYQSREQEVSDISRELKAIAKELDCPLVALSQLSRASEQRADHKPQLSDLRESGSQEQDADVVAFIFREEYYRQTDENFNLADIIIAKNRNGATGSVTLTFLKELTRFEDLYRDDFDRAERAKQSSSRHETRESEFKSLSEIKPEWSDLEAADL